MPTLVGLAGGFYIAVATVLGLTLMALCAKFARDRSAQTARQLFLFSITYLPLLWGALVADRPLDLVVQILDLPVLNATLNGLAAIFLTAGYVQIRRGRRDVHKRCMLAALVTSALFLVSYVTYHLNVGSRPFPGQGVIRVIYFAILITHVVLAATTLPLALVTAARGLKGSTAATSGSHGGRCRSGCTSP